MEALTQPRVLLVEDNAGDVRLIREGFQEAQIPLQMSVAPDGEEAIRRLRGLKTGERQLPDLVLLDLKLPRKGGLEVLAEIKADPVLKGIPVLVLTSSDAHEDIRRSYELQASCYLRKPHDFNGMVALAKRIGGFWFSDVSYP